MQKTMWTMSLQAVPLFFILSGLRHATGQLRCNVGVDITDNDGKLSNTYAEQVCPESLHQSCLTASVNVTINEDTDALMLVSYCATECEKEKERECVEVLRNIASIDYEGESVQYNISSCEVECCTTNLCNRKPVPIKQNPRLQCYSGERQSTRRYGLVKDNIVPVTCPEFESLPDRGVSCFRVTFEKTEGQLEDVGNLVLAGCQPRTFCETFTCDDIVQMIPEAERDDVTTCDFSCCRSDLCNGTSSIASRLLLTSLYGMYLLLYVLIVAF